MHEVSQHVVPRSRASQTHAGMRESILAALEPILFSSPAHGYVARSEFEERFAAIVEQPFACAVHSGTIGLYLALRACGVRVGDEVVTVGNSDVSTTAAISHCGATPVLCDVLPSDYTIDTDAVEACLGPRTKALLPVDLYGHPADVRRLREIADRHGLTIIEDAALATGARDHGRPVGAFADATVYSFAPVKPLGSVGNGAMVTSHDPRLARSIRALAGYGQVPDVRAERAGQQAHVVEGINVPLDPLQAALLTVKLANLEAWTGRRRELADLYRRELPDSSVQMPQFRSESEPTFRSFTVLVDDQQHVYEGLQRAGIDAVLHYAPPVFRQPVYASGLRGSDRLPVTEHLSAHLVCLPVTPELTNADVAYVATTLGALVERIDVDGH